MMSEGIHDALRQRCPDQIIMPGTLPTSYPTCQHLGLPIFIVVITIFIVRIIDIAVSHGIITIIVSPQIALMDIGQEICERI